MEDIRGIQHPLQTPLVLDCVFKNLSVSDLKSCRQVCRAWGQEATKAMRPLVYVDIGSGGVTNFLGLVQSKTSTFSEVPFANEFHITFLNDAEEGSAFFEFCGRSVKSLNLTKVNFESGEEFDHAVFQSCPNLEKLTLEDVHVDGNSGGEPSDWIPTYFPQKPVLKCLTFSGGTEIIGVGRMAILSYCSSLEVLKVDNDEIKTDWIFKSLAILREPDKEGWPLKNMSVTFVDLEEPLAILPLFVEGSSALETFRGVHIKTPEHVNVLRKILEANSKSLKDLDLVQYPVEDLPVVMNISTPPNNIVLEKLERLSLCHVELPSTSFLRSVPNLRRLRFDECQGQPTPPVKFQFHFKISSLPSSVNYYLNYVLTI